MSDELPRATEESETLSLHAERLDVQRRSRKTGEVRVAVHTRSRDALVDEQLTRVEAKIEHVPVGRFVDEMPPIREEGDTTVIPVVEEVVVRRLLLKEEVRITRAVTTRPHRETVTLRYQDVVVSRTALDAEATDAVAFNNKL